MKTKEELNALKKEVEALNKKLAELTEEELEQVSGGLIPPLPFKGTFNGNAKLVKPGLDFISNQPVSAVDETDEQLVKGGVIPSSKTL